MLCCHCLKVTDARQSDSLQVVVKSSSLYRTCFCHHCNMKAPVQRRPPLETVSAWIESIQQICGLNISRVSSRPGTISRDPLRTSAHRPEPGRPAPAAQTEAYKRTDASLARTSLRSARGRSLCWPVSESKRSFFVIAWLWNLLQKESSLPLPAICKFCFHC